MSNYLPDGVTDAHPYFNPQEGSVHVVCGNDSATVVPVHALNAGLEKLTALLSAIPTGTMAYGPSPTAAKAEGRRVVEDLQALIEHAEQESDYECPFEGVMDVAISEEAEWTCPLCGSLRTSDTTPDERDPDEEWERDNER